MSYMNRYNGFDAYYDFAPPKVEIKQRVPGMGFGAELQDLTCGFGFWHSCSER